MVIKRLLPIDHVDEVRNDSAEPSVSNPCVLTAAVQPGPVRRGRCQAAEWLLCDQQRAVLVARYR